jgi:hypothetical protein
MRTDVTFELFVLRWCIRWLVVANKRPLKFCFIDGNRCYSSVGDIDGLIGIVPSLDHSLRHFNSIHA